jgi:AP-1 complex subunit gamma-1
LIATTPDLQTYSVQKLYAALKDDVTQEGLILAGTWVIGEYGDALLRGGQYEEEELVKEVRESDIVDIFTTILNSAYSGQVVTQYIVTSLMKLTTRLTEPAQIERIRRMLLNYQTNLDIEIQQRSAEYGNLFAFDQIRRGVLEKMPAPEIREESRVFGEATKKSNKAVSKKKPSQMTEQDMLLDLMGDTNMPTTDESATVNGSQNNADLLADILGGSSSSPPPQTASAPQANVASIMDLFGTNNGTASPAAAPQSSASADLFGGMSSPPPTVASPPPTGGPPLFDAYNKNGLYIAFQTRRDASSVQIMARFRNSSPATQFSSVSLQAAVPKTQRLQLQAISSGDLAPGATASQQMRVQSVNGVCFLSILPLTVQDSSLMCTTASASQVAIETEGWLRHRRRSTHRGAGGLDGTDIMRWGSSVAMARSLHGRGERDQKPEFLLARRVVVDRQTDGTYIGVPLDGRTART